MALFLLPMLLFTIGCGMDEDSDANILDPPSADFHFQSLPLARAGGSLIPLEEIPVITIEKTREDYEVCLLGKHLSRFAVIYGHTKTTPYPDCKRRSSEKFSSARLKQLKSDSSMFNRNLAEIDFYSHPQTGTVSLNASGHISGSC